MPSTVGLLPQYLVEACLTSTPTTFVTIPNRIVACQIARGRADELNGPMQTGAMTLTLDNGDGAFSPDNPSSPYAGNLLPRRAVRVSARFDSATAWNPLYYGYIDSIRPIDNGPADSNVIIQCIDWLGKMSLKSVTGTISSGGPGIHDIINSFNSLMGIVNGSITRGIVNATDGTSQHLLDYALVNANALQALSDFAATVHGVLFAAVDGSVRATANGATATTTLFNNFFVFDQPGINLAANVVPYTNMDYDLTTQYLFNDITITAPPSVGGPQRVQDAASIAAYDKMSYAASFAYMGQDQAIALANTLLLAYRAPHPRVHSLTVDVDGATGITQGGHSAADLLFQLELTAPVAIAKSQPGNLGISRDMVVEGIKHDIKPDYGGTGAMHEITLLLAERSEINPEWQLGISRLGVDTVLGYAKPPFDPLSIPGCTLWLASDKGVTLSGGNVTSWADQSGNGNTAAPAGSDPPPYRTGLQAGLPAVLTYSPFSGRSCYFTLATGPLPYTWTAFIVVNPGVATDFLHTSGPGSAGRGLSTSSYYAAATDSDGTNFVRATDTAGGRLFGGNVCIISGSGSSGYPVVAYGNGSSGTAAYAASSLSYYTPTGGTVGDTSVSPGGAQYQFWYCVLCYNRVLTDTERAAVLNGLNAKYLIY